MRNIPGLIATCVAATAIPRHTIVALNTADDSVQLATGVSDPLLGVSAEPADIAKGERIDVILNGIAEVRAGGAISKGAWLTVDASGRAIAASAATNERIGRALNAANTANDIISIEIIKGLG